MCQSCQCPGKVRSKVKMRCSHVWGPGDTALSLSGLKLCRNTPKGMGKALQEYKAHIAKVKVCQKSHENQRLRLCSVTHVFWAILAINVNGVIRSIALSHFFLETVLETVIFFGGGGGQRAKSAHGIPSKS